MFEARSRSTPTGVSTTIRPLLFTTPPRIANTSASTVLFRRITPLLVNTLLLKVRSDSDAKLGLKSKKV